MNRLFVIIVLFIAWQTGSAQCNAYFDTALSPRTTNYNINVILDHPTRMIQCTQTIQFTNKSPISISELRFYMYLNAFKNTESSFLKGTSNIFGQPFLDKKPDEWGWIDVLSIIRKENTAQSDLSDNMKYISPDDGNTKDQSVLAVILDKALAPGKTIELQLTWSAKMPKTIARAGNSKDFYLFCHWFPQLGVFEQDNSGNWNWNCHQFFRTTEFYADFGVYDVNITCDSMFTMAASGCLTKEQRNANGTITRSYHLEDVIDFTWAIYTNFKVHREQWKDVQIQIYVPKDYTNLIDRYSHILKFSLEYLEKHVGKYPFPTISVVCPPFHALNSGLMEYPTLITTGSFYSMPRAIRTTESLLVHEFVHQYFMGIVASNEKEEPWLDEGFATYFEDRIIDAAYGNNGSLVDFFGVKINNRDLTRLEYTGMENPRAGIVARPAWEFDESTRKELIYSKTATCLHTIENILGQEKMDAWIKSYYEAWKFKHPRGKDVTLHFNQFVQEQVDSTIGLDIKHIFETGIYQTSVLDYAISAIHNEYTVPPRGIFGLVPEQHIYKEDKILQEILSSITVQRNGDWVLPVELLLHFEDGTRKTIFWNGKEGTKTFLHEGLSKVVSAQIDPQFKLFLDINKTNNSLTLKQNTAPIYGLAARFIFWIQNLFQTLSLLF